MVRAPQPPLQPHPVAALFPMLGADDLRALAEDIAENGLVEEIVLHHHLILDGRNRLAGCELAGVEPTFREWRGEESEIVPWILSRNLHRRHLSTSQRAQLAADLCKFAELSVGEAASLANVSPRSVHHARVVEASGDEDLIAAVRAGDLTVSAGAELAAAPASDRAVVLEAPIEKRKGALAEARERRRAGVPSPMLTVRAGAGPCGALHPQTGRPCEHPREHTYSHSHLVAGRRAWWTDGGEVGPVPEEPAPAAPVSAASPAEDPRCGALHPETGLRCWHGSPDHIGAHGNWAPDRDPVIWVTEDQMAAAKASVAHLPGWQAGEAAIKRPGTSTATTAPSPYQAALDQLLGGELERATTATTPDIDGELAALEQLRPVSEALADRAAAPDGTSEDDEDEKPISKSKDYDGDSWSTPDYLLEAAREVLGGDIDLDPASNPEAQTRVRAALFYTKSVDGLSKTWSGRVWLNPPYSNPSPFVSRLLEAYASGSVVAAVVLLNNATDASWCQLLLGRGFPACFLKQRVPFLYDGVPVKGTRQGQVVFYMGRRREFIEVFSRLGVCVEAVGFAR